MSPRVPNLDTVRHMQRQAGSASDFYGAAVTWRKYISASAGNPEAGVADSACFQLRPARWDLKPLTIQETQMLGGQQFGGSIRVRARDEINARDEMVYLNRVYRFVTDPMTDRMGEMQYWEVIAARADVTGFY